MNLEEPASETIINRSTPPISTKEPIVFPKKLFFGAVLILLFAGIIYFLTQSGVFTKLKEVKLPAISKSSENQSQVSEPVKTKTPRPKISTEQVSKILTNDERKQLLTAFHITVPRQLSEDEEAILKKQVSLPAKLSEQPKLVAGWKKDEFEKMVSAEQKKTRHSTWLVLCKGSN